MTDGVLICIIGIDGAGKTTQANKLVDNLKNHGIESRYVYGRIIPILPRPFMYVTRKLFLSKQNIYSDFKGYNKSKKNLLKNNKIAAKAYENLILLDYILQVFFKIYMPIKRGNILISDRYVYDTIVTDLAVDLDYDDAKIKNTIERLFYIIPRPKVAFYIDLPEEVAFKRKNDVPAIDYLVQRRVHYKNVARWFGMDEIDGTKEMAEIETYIFNKSLKIWG